MNKFVSFFKRNTKFIIVLVLLVAFQVFFDLTIPNYTYNIVDTGIINEGVEEDIPLVIRRSAMKSLTDFMTDSDKEKVLDSYSFINKKYERYIKKYPVLEDEAIYILNGDRIEGIDEILENAILLELGNTYPEIEKEIPKLVTKENENLKDCFKRLSEEEKEVFLDKFVDSKENISRLSRNSYINNYIKDEYKEVGYKTSTSYGYLIIGFIKLIVIFILKILVLIYLVKKIMSYSLNITKVLSKEILGKSSRLMAKELEKLDVKSLVVKNRNDIWNFPILMFTLIEEIIYVMVFVLLFKFIINKDINISLFLVLSLILLVIISIIMFIVSKRKRIKNINKLVVSYYLLMVIEVIILLVVLVVGIVLSCFKINYIRLLSLNLGELLWLIGLSLEFVVCLMFVVMAFFSFILVYKISKKIVKLEGSTNYIKEPDRPRKIRKNAKKYVEFKDVMSNLSFKINANSIFGILCGSSDECNEITRLLLKQEPLKKGDIVIDGVSINDLEIRDLRTKICCFYPRDVWYYEEDLESTKFLKSPDIYLLNDYYGDLVLDDDEALNYFLTKKQKNKIVIIVTTNIDNLSNANKIAVVKKKKLVMMDKYREIIKNNKII